jgi:hypothetical protein
MQGCGKPFQKLCLEILVESRHSDIIILQKIMGGGEFISKLLESLFTHWMFTKVDSIGHLGGLAIVWNHRFVKVLKFLVI